MEKKTAEIDKIRELGKIEVAYDRQLACFGKKEADGVLFFWMKGYEKGVAQREAEIIEIIKKVAAIFGADETAHDAITTILHSIQDQEL